MEPTTAVAFGAAVLLAFAHVLAAKLRFLGGIPRSRTLSAAGGVSVAYVFLHLLPELAKAQEEFGAANVPLLTYVERHVYLIALVGLTVFYGLDRLALESREEQRENEGEDETSSGVFWLHTISFGLYNLLVGYLLLHREERSLKALLLFSVAMALHFVVNDFGLLEHHKEKYLRIGRWIVSVAVLLGWGIGALTDISDMVIAVLLAFLAGGIVLNVLKEEVPGERKSRFWAFAAGMGAYAVLLLAM